MLNNDFVRLGLVLLAAFLLLQLLNRTNMTPVSNKGTVATKTVRAPTPTKPVRVENYEDEAEDEDEDEDEGFADEEPVVESSSSGADARPKDCFPKDQLSAQDLLPGDTNSTWAAANPDGQGTLDDKNFLNAGYHHGVNTVGQSLRNANWQLRSDPPNPQVKVSPWMQSTIEPDTNRKPLEIGCGGN